MPRKSGSCGVSVSLAGKSLASVTATGRSTFVLPPCLSTVPGLSSLPGAQDGMFGGGRIGAVLISRFIKPGTVSEVPYNHYSLLKSIEDIFGVDHLGYARPKSVTSFGDDIFVGGPTPAASKSPAPATRKD